MLPKVAHYAGFQSYGDLPYPSLKPGRKELQTNTVYQETVRENDQLKFYSNTNRWETLYDQKLSKNVEPKDYVNPLRVTKTQVEKPLLATAGKLSTLNNTTLKRTYGPAEPVEPFNEKNKGLQLFNQTVSSLKRDKDDLNQSQRNRSSSYQPLHKSGQLPQQPLDDYDYLQSGTEHWKTTYAAAIVDPYALTKASRPEWSLNQPPYSVKEGPRTTENKGQFGDRGENPLQKLSQLATMPPVPKPEESLVLGTTKASHHIPGYTGHLPKALVDPYKWDQALGTHSRSSFVKNNITENYQTRIPGYSGHKPANAINDRGTLRQFCFSTAGERFF